ncbi:RusA family crossover junction endodeoxyribonuclease [Deinococcus daejeonensis]|uniref:Crossover junction endodeoxyribonuclease RusA n=1 Tax=Deinococcus daejeonensis TaxID=1007098 RepID=A0ABQ2IWI9_9DEIO|nr:RusA family crossover junction endodeoxyribonuclease [Deinococcus daejeonensis]GGN32339.1 crossover junction endodeoxyribonuclease rusA [Deinococcus daejeonensis]
MIVLPWPPSVNRMWRSVRGRNILSKHGREYREAGLEALQAQAPRCWPADVRLSVSICVYPPDRRRRDLDNMPKAVLDLLTHGGVYGDDSQIDRLEIVRRECHPGGRVIVDVRCI